MRSQGLIPRRTRFPRMPLFAALALVAFSAAATIFGQITEIGTVRVASGQPVAMRDLVFDRQSDGSTAIADAISGDLIEIMEADAGGFILGTVRGLTQTRSVRKIAPETPYRLIAWSDGALTLSDTGTGERVVLNAFGPTNEQAFRVLLEQKGS